MAGRIGSIGKRSNDPCTPDWLEGTITYGAWREDVTDPVDQQNTSVTVSLSHFWNADNNDYDDPIITPYMFAGQRNANIKARMYWRGEGWYVTDLFVPSSAGQSVSPTTETFNKVGGGTITLTHYGIVFIYDGLANLYKTGIARIVGYWEGRSTSCWATGNGGGSGYTPLSGEAVWVYVNTQFQQNRVNRIVWEVLGRIAHLLADMSVPAHVHERGHPCDPDASLPDRYEVSMGTNGYPPCPDRNNPPASFYAMNWNYQNPEVQKGLINVVGMANPIRYLMYSMNQITDHYPSNTFDENNFLAGDNNYYNGSNQGQTIWSEDDYAAIQTEMQNEGSPPASVNVDQVANKAFTYAIRATAGLLHLFASEAGLLPTMLVKNVFPRGLVKVQEGTGGLLQYQITGANGIGFLTSSGTQFTLEAISPQNYSDPSGVAISRVFEKWTRLSTGQSFFTNSIAVIVSGSETYTMVPKNIISGTQTVVVGQTFTVQSSMNPLYFDNGAKLTVNGTMNANGANQRINLTSLNQPNSWQGIEFNGSSSSSLQYCDINYALAPITATNSSNLTVNNVTVDNWGNYGYDAIRLYGSSANISNTTINGRWDSYSGIRFSQGSSGSVTYSTIQNCGVGMAILIEGGSSALIQSNTLYNNRYPGVYVAFNGSAMPLIKYNTVSSNGGGDNAGMSLNNSQAELWGNTVQTSYAGIWAWFSSYLRSTDLSSYWVQGNNIITNCNLGLAAYYGSTVTFGLTQEFDNYRYYYGACNHIYNNTWLAVAAEQSTLDAHGNWWGSSPPDPNKFSMSGNSSLSYYAWRPLPDDNCPPEEAITPLAANVGNEDVLGHGDELKEAHRALFLKQFDNATTKYRSVLANSTKSEEREQALRGLYNVFRHNRNAALISDVAQNRSVGGRLGLVATELLASIYLAAGDFSQAQSVANEIKSANPGTDYEMRALMLLASLRGHSSSLASVSTAALKELREKFGSKVDKAFVVAMGSSAEEIRQVSNASNTGDEQTISSYPNPFNPSTRIQFKLSEPGFVSLRVYDLLGREVGQLINEERQPGRHEVVWDASKLPSGLYFARIDTQGKTHVHKMILMR
ncbi:MAG: right-handed parallel beta-helix repeat-containing protein [Ignavibacteriales bacterium]|nr:right-handed parallel beta-helix repeat-containing protein [Ignavibacteriales bacterium]